MTPARGERRLSLSKSDKVSGPGGTVLRKDRGEVQAGREGRPGRRGGFRQPPQSQWPGCRSESLRRQTPGGGDSELGPGALWEPGLPALSPSVWAEPSSAWSSLGAPRGSEG